MPSRNDETGVMRRQFFQAVIRDVRIQVGSTAAQQPVRQPTLPLVQSQDSNWRQRLQQSCEEALVGQHGPRLCSAAEQLGVALWSEVLEVAGEMANLVGLRPLERRRLLAALQSSQPN